MRYISNDYITYKCFSYDSTVYFYTYDDKELELNGEYDIIFYNLYGHTNKDNKITVKTDGYLTLDKGLTPDIVFKNFSSKVSCETTTMKDVVDEIYGRSVTYGLEGISDIDRYNYCINSMIYSKMMPCFYDTINFYDTTYYYEYTLEFQAYEVLENEVVAPLYTTIYRRTTPNTIYIKYLLSPASTFKDFSDLTVRINTNLYILNDKYGFKAVVGGYELHYDDLPHKEIDLKFASSPTVKEENNDSPLLIMIIIGLSLLICAPIIVFSIIYYKKTKGEKKDTLGLIEFISVLVLLPICASAIFGAFNYIEGVLYISILIMILLMVINIVNWAKNRKKLPNKLGLIILICVVYILGLCFSNWYLLALAALGVIGYIVLYFISRKE